MHWGIKYRESKDRSLLGILEKGVCAVLDGPVSGNASQRRFYRRSTQQKPCSVLFHELDSGKSSRTC
ncbi:hypothetical protein HOLleu_36980 [Holothuria leucospilota]|uniref:Uncharacterized protein n=1 Tax=Holothuria leucospilota TaxID=206669 RepID=A0A9Q0YPE3_HOLLE|nr:hypothetical protein HOLleu_36980 [Holothuria leucospilota]